MTVLELKKKIDEARESLSLRKRMAMVRIDPSLYIIVTGKSSTWYGRIDRDNKQKLGTYPEISLSEARRMNEVLKAKHEALMEEAKQVPMLKDFYPKFLEEYNRQGHQKRIANLRSYWKHLKDLGDVRLNELLPKTVIPVLKAAPVAQNYKALILQGLKQALDYALMLGEIELNPLANLPRSNMNPLKKVATEGFRWLPAEQLKEGFFRKLEILTEQQRAVILYVTLAAARIGEGLGLRWDWVDEEAEEIRLPGEATKTGAAHAVVMTPEIKAFLKKWAKTHPELMDSEYVFPSNRSHSRQMGYTLLSTVITTAVGGTMTIHGMRKAASTWMHAHGFREMAERCLSHKVGNVVERTYDHADYHKEKMECLSAWDAYVRKNCLTPGFLALL